MLSELSERELEVLKLLVIGHSNGQISNKLFIAPSTVKAHVGAILYKLNVKNRIQAATIAAYFFDIKPEDIVKSANRLKVC
ncbi:MAG: helix-turn-helix transcriptional regulator [Fusobacterium sp.]|nr:helix-turn-helix transcriptional regulator [Fusobacterium sp.]